MLLHKNTQSGNEFLYVGTRKLERSFVSKIDVLRGRELIGLIFVCHRHQISVQRGDSANKERGGRHLLANYKFRGFELAATSAACHSAPKPDQQQARHTL